MSTDMTSPDDPLYVLVVSHDRPLRRRVADTLSRAGLSVTVEQDVGWAVESFRRRQYAAVLIDDALPNGTAPSLAWQVSAQGQTPPPVLVLLSGGAVLEELPEASCVLGKPLKRHALMGLLAAELGDRLPQPGQLDEGSDDDRDGTSRGGRDETGGAEEGSGPVDPSAAAPLAGDADRQEASEVEAASRIPPALAPRDGSAPTLAGNLRERPFPELLAELYRRRATGALLLRREKVKKIVFMRDGQPQLIKSNLLSECLGRLMVRERLISEADCEASLKAMKERGRQQGTILVEMGRLSPQNLVYALELQLRSKLFELFGWQSGEFRFDSRTPPPPSTVGLELSNAAAIYEGIVRAYDARRVSEALGDVGALYVHPASDPLFALQEVSLSEEEQRLVDSANGRFTVGQLRETSDLPRLDIDRLIYAMRCAGVLVLSAAPAPEAERSLSAHARSGPPPLTKTRPSGRNELLPEILGPDEEEIDLELDVTHPYPKPPQLGGEPDGGLEEAFDSALGVAAGERDLEEQLLRRLAAARRQTYFQLLGVQRDVDDVALERAYLELAHPLHPDRLGRTPSAEVRQLAGELYALVTRAWNTLRDPSERARYLEAEQVASHASPADELSLIIDAERRFREGQSRLQRGELAEAHGAFREAVELFPRESAFHAWLGWSRHKLAPDDETATDEALASLQQAIEIDPQSHHAYLFTGYVTKARGDTDSAQTHFEKAIQANPECHEALKELSILEWAARLGGGKRRKEKRR